MSTIAGLNPSVLAAVDRMGSQQAVATAMLKKGLEVEKANGEAVLTLIDSAGKASNSKGIDVFV